MYKYALWLQMRRVLIFPLAFVIAHAAHFIWEATDPSYVPKATFIVEWTLKPLHPWMVWLVEKIMPPFAILAGNKQPTYVDAPRIVYTLFIAVVSFTLLVVWWLLKRAVVGTSYEMTEEDIRLDERNKTLAELRTQGIYAPSARQPTDDSLAGRLERLPPRNIT